MKFYRQLTPIKAMSFDLDDTLYDNRPVIRRLTREVTAWLHHHHPISTTQSEAWWQALKMQLAEQDNWLFSDVALWRHTTIYQGLLRLGYSAPQAKQAADDLMQVVVELRSDFTVPAMTHQVMAKLAQQFPLVAITNGNVDVERIGLSDYFSLILRAGPNGRAKPEADMFTQAQQFLALSPAQILHVGDHLTTDVAGAKHSGFQACWVNDQGLCLRQQKHAMVLPDVEITQLDELLQL